LPKNLATKKQKVDSTASANPIGMMDILNVDVQPAQPPAKRQKTTSDSSSHVRFDAVEIQEKSNPTPKATRWATRSTKVNSKKEAGELFGQLAKEFQAISKTCEKISEALE